MGPRQLKRGPGKTDEVFQLPFPFEESIPASSAAHQEDQSIHTGKGALALRERLVHYGAREISNGELLSLILCNSAGKEALFSRVETLLRAYGGLSWLMQADYEALTSEYGLGEVKAAQLQAILELARRLTIPPTQERYQIGTPNDAAQLVMAEMAYLDHEEVRLLVLDTKNQVLANIRLYRGTLDSTTVRVAELFRPAITRNAAGIVMIHNQWR